MSPAAEHVPAADGRPAEWRGIAARIFLWSLLVLAIGSQPCALLFPEINFDDRGLRLWLTAAVVLPALAWGWQRQRHGQSLAPAAVAALLGVSIPFLPPGLHGYGIAFALPAPVLLLVPAAAVLLLTPFALPRLAWLAAAVYALAVLAQLVREPQRAADTLALLGYLLVPAAVAVSVQTAKLSPLRLAWAALALWLLTVVHTLAQWQGGDQMLRGISGNPNWLSSVLLGVLPWAAWAVAEWLIRRRGWRAAAAWTAAGALVGLPAGLILLRCNSRALLLGLGAYAALALCYRLRRPLARVALVVVLLGLAAAVVLRWGPTINRRDVRLPLWHSTATLALEHPLGGAGPAGFERELPAIMAQSGYYDRAVAGEIAEHPHNEILNVAVLLGLPAALALTLLLLPLLGDPRRGDTAARLAFFAAFGCTFMGLFDRGLTRAPSNVVWLAALGLCWVPFVRREAAPAWWQRTRGRYALAALAAVALAAVAGWAAVPVIAHNWLYRRGLQALAAGKPAVTLLAFDRALAWLPGATATAYHAAGVAMHDLGDVPRADHYVGLVHGLNPDYAHNHRRIALICRHRGQPERALEFFRRDLALFPQDALALQWYFLQAAELGREDELAAIEDRLRQRYAQRYWSMGDFWGLPDAGGAWLTAMRAGDWPRAGQQATAAVARIESHAWYDPLAPWAQDDTWPPEFLGLEFSPADVPYWDSLRWRAGLTATQPPRGDPQAVATAVLDRIAVAPEDAPWQWPAAAWASGRASPESVLAALAWLVEPAGAVTVAGRYPADGRLVAVLLGAQTPFVVDLESRRVTPAPPGALAALLPADFGTASSVVALPHDFLARHRILLALARQPAGPAGLGVGASPAVRVARARAALAQTGIVWQPAQPLWPLPLAAVKASLFPPPPAPPAPPPPAP